jgi:hypothetical protein
MAHIPGHTAAFDESPFTLLNFFVWLTEVMKFLPADFLSANQVQRACACKK